MRKFKYIRLTEEEQTEEIVLTEEDILREYWEFWSRKMSEKYGQDHEFITDKNCIEDWVSSHWATEFRDES